MKTALYTAMALAALSSPAFAEGDAEAGRKAFSQCKSCHAIADPEGDVLVKGGRTGPNLFGVIGRQAGSADFRYSKALISAGEGGLVWDEASLAAFAENPRGFLTDLGGDNKTKMTFKMRKGAADVAAYLATFSPAVEEAPQDGATEEAPEDSASDESAS